MTIEAHLHAVEEKRLKLKQQIETEMHRPMPDFQRITELKKLNMKLKEEAMRYSMMRKKVVGET